MHIIETDWIVAWLVVAFLHFFIHRSSRMIALLLGYHSTALYTCKGDISASVIFGGLLLNYFYIRKPSQTSLATSVYYPTVFIYLYSICCIMLTTNDYEVVDCGMRMLSYGLRYSIKSLRIILVADRGRLYN